MKYHRDEYLISAYGRGIGHLDLDRKILDAVGDGHVRLQAICAALGEADERKIDRRIQWLRKRGFLAYDAKEGWMTLPPEKSAGAS